MNGGIVFMIFIFYIFCIFNIFFLYFKLDIIYYLTLIEGILGLIICLKGLPKNSIFFFKNKYKITSTNVKKIKIYLIICSLLFVVLSPFYIFNIMPYDTSTFFLCALPILLLGFISNELKKCNAKN